MKTTVSAVSLVTVKSATPLEIVSSVWLMGLYVTFPTLSSDTPIVTPETALPKKSVKVAVRVDVVAPSAVTVDGDSANVESSRLGRSAVNSTVAVCVIGCAMLVIVPWNVSVPEVVTVSDLTMKQAWPLALVVPFVMDPTSVCEQFTACMYGVPMPALLATVTTSFSTGLLSASLIVAVNVLSVTPFATTLVEPATNVDVAMSEVPYVTVISLLQSSAPSRVPLFGVMQACQSSPAAVS